MVYEGVLFPVCVITLFTSKYEVYEWSVRFVNLPLSKQARILITIRTVHTKVRAQNSVFRIHISFALHAHFLSCFLVKYLIKNNLVRNTTCSEQMVYSAI